MRNVFSVEDRLRNIPFPDPTQQVNLDQVGVVIILPEYVFINKDDEIGVAVWDYQD